MKNSKTTLLISCLLCLNAIMLYAQSINLEPWVTKSIIKTANNAPNFSAEEAKKVAGGITLESLGEHTWSPSVEGAEGILVVHPLSQSMPATIKYQYMPSEAKNKKFVFKVRGSDKEPGVLVQIISSQKPIKLAKVDRKWESIEVPATEIPTGSHDIIIEIYPIGWNMEYAYIDFIGFK